MPILAPATRRVAAGVLVEPRFTWTALGQVLAAVGFSVAPTLGGLPLVPGSAREVPPWVIAGPVLRRIEAILRHRPRTFVPQRDVRQAPRGRVDWGEWARTRVPTGRWTELPCEYSDLDNEPDLFARIRWTLSRISDELSADPVAEPSRRLREAIATIELLVGAGERRRPDPAQVPSHVDVPTLEAVEAMGWVAEERGLGGSRALDGLAWEMTVAAIWEAWARAFAGDLAPRLGLSHPGAAETRRPLRWEGHIKSMGALAPDIAMIGDGRSVWIDAKYKAHMSQVARHGWVGLSAAVRDAHRADLHQALAYASLSDSDRVDTVLLYPQLGPDGELGPTAIATVTSGRRRVRLVLATLPFGFRTPLQRDRALTAWQHLLAA